MLFGRKCLGQKSIFMLPLAVFLACALVLTGCRNGTEARDDERVLVLADASWSSIQEHNRIVGFILQHGYEYAEPQYMFGIPSR